MITKTIDARGFDADNQQVGERPNPQTGPFFVEGAEPGDVLVVRFGKIEPSRPTAWSSSVLAPYTADPAYLRHEAEREQTTETWEIDKDRWVARVASEAIKPGGDRSATPANAGMRRGRAGAQGGRRDEYARGLRWEHGL